jgi:hypothetical protein
MEHKTYTIELSTQQQHELLTILRAIGLKDHDTIREVMNQPYWRAAVSRLHGKASAAQAQRHVPREAPEKPETPPPAKDAAPGAYIFNIQLTPGRRNQLSTILNAIRAGDGRALGEMSNDVQWRNVSRQLLLAIDRADDAVWGLPTEKRRIEELANAVALLRGFVAEQKPKNAAERAIIRDWESSLKELANAVMDSWPDGAAGTEAPQPSPPDTLTPDQRARVILLIERTRDAVAHNLPASYLWSKDLIEIRDALGGGPGASETPKTAGSNQAMCLLRITPGAKSRLMSMVDTSLRSGAAVANPMELVEAWDALTGSGVTAPTPEKSKAASSTMLSASDGDELYHVRLTLFQKHQLLDLFGSVRAKLQGKIPSTLAERSVAHDQNQKLNDLEKAIYNSVPEPTRNMVEMKNGWDVYTYKRPSAVGQPAPFTPDMATVHLEKAKRALSPDGRIRFDFPVKYVVLGGQAYILPDEGVPEEA